MKLQSIVSSWNIILGYFTMHLTLYLLSRSVVAPSEDKLAALLEDIEIEDDNDQCYDAAQIEKALTFAQDVHFWAMILLFYMEIHNKLWRRIIKLLHKCAPETFDTSPPTLNEVDYRRAQDYIHELDMVEHKLINKQDPKMLAADGESVVAVGRARSSAAKDDNDMKSTVKTVVKEDQAKNIKVERMETED